MLSTKTCLDKHKRYKQKYGKNEIYWGIGIENEMYLEFETKARISKDFFIFNHKRERYSVDYYTTSYKEKELKAAFFEYAYDLKEIDLPILVNGHTFTHADSNNQPKTTYEKEPKPNKSFNGKTVHEILMDNPYFAKHYNVDFVYDGDTVEFITQDFYKKTVKEVVSELEMIKTNFINEIQPIFPFRDEYGKVKLMEKNYPFAVHLTNLKNVAMFNNGTYHFNFTLPTQLNEKGDIENKELFIKEHQNAIRMLQLFEPILMVIYGTPDPFSNLSSRFSKASQRCAVSRYIGIGTYSSEKMKEGKILNVKTDELIRNFWYNDYHKDTSYKKLDEIGIDINFNKHHYHGIEFRIFDYFPHSLLEELLEFIVHLFDHSMEYDTVHDIVKTKQWNELMVNCMRSGKDTIIPPSQMFLFNEVFGTKYRSMNILNFFNTIKFDLKKKYGNNGKCSLYMLHNGKDDKKVEYENVQKTNTEKVEVNMKRSTQKNIKRNFQEIEINIDDVVDDFCCLNINLIIDKMSELQSNVENIQSHVADVQSHLQNVQEQIVADIQNEVENKVADVQNEIENKVADVQNEIENKVADVQNEIENKVADVQNEIENKVADAQAQLQNVQHQIVADIQNEVENKVADIQNEIENKVADIQNEVENKVADIQNEIENKVAGIQNEIENKVADTQAQLQNVQHQIENKVADVQNEIENKVAGIQNEIENKVADVQNEIENKVAQLQNVQNEIENKVADIQNEIENKVADAEAQIQNEIENKVAQLQNVQNEIENKVAAAALKMQKDAIKNISNCCIIH